jgi:hypothetical protein
MRALTIHQPWASLIAAGLKTIETRAWATKHRGQIVIHAGQQAAQVPMVSMRLWAAAMDGQQERGVKEWTLLPTGAAVAVAQLVDCVPMVHTTQPRNGHCLVVGDRRLILHGEPTVPGRDVSDQLPFGDFTSGRWAWLIEDIRPLPEPVPAQGHQGLSGRLVAEAACGVRPVDSPFNEGAGDA